MRRWQWIATAMLLSSFVVLARAGTALAQDGDDTADVFSWVLAKIAALVDNLLGYWVSGDTLTDPMGESLASSITSIVQSLAVFFAQFSTLL